MGKPIQVVHVTVLYLSLVTAKSFDLNDPRTVPDKEIVLLPGENLTVTCEGNTAAEWYFQGKKLNELQGEAGRLREESYSRNGTVISRLTVMNATFLDTGFYYCGPKSNGTEREITPLIYVYVDDESHLMVTENGYILVYAVQSRNLTIPCRPTSPQTNVTLFQNGNLLDWPFYNYSGFVYANADELLKGFYRCVATKSNITSFADVQVSIGTIPEVKKKKPEQKMYPREGSFTVEYELEGYIPDNKITILSRTCPRTKPCTSQFTNILEKSEPNSLEYSEGDSSVQIMGFAREPTEYVLQACNEYGCSATDTSDARFSILVDDSADVFLVTASSYNPGPGDPVNISCNSTLHNYNGRFLWYWTDLNGRTVNLTNNETSVNTGFYFYPRGKKFSHAQEIVWKAIPVSASGIYTCSTEANGSYTNHSITIIVKNVVKPWIVNDITEDITFDQDSKILTCEGNGYPAPNMTWYKDEGLYMEALPPFHNSTSIRVNASSTKEETYTCLFTNKVGNATKTFRLRPRVAEKSIGFVAATAVCCVLVLLLLLVLGVRVYKDMKRKSLIRLQQREKFERGDLKRINSYLTMEGQADLLPYDNRWEFPRNRLRLGKVIGSGAFGRVFKAEAVGILSDESVSTVAVKMIKSRSDTAAFKALLSEMKIMIHIGSHPNIVNLMGACTKHVEHGELFVIVEYCRYGNLQQFLINHRRVFVNQLSLPQDSEVSSKEKHVTISSETYDSKCSTRQDSTGSILSDPDSRPHHLHGSIKPYPLIVCTDSTIAGTGASTNRTMASISRTDFSGDFMESFSTADLINWAFQITGGMEYLTKKKVMHGDLAARNVLLADNKIAKIADFGLSREVYRAPDYKKKGEDPLPLKWMAPESIVDRIFSIQSDVWSFGVVLWEMFSLGKTPYPGLNVDESFVNNITEGYRMKKPHFAPDDVYEVMKQCWRVEPAERPSFSVLQDTFADLLERCSIKQNQDANNVYNEQNPHSDYLVMSSNYSSAGNSESSKQLEPNSFPRAESGPRLDKSDYLIMTCNTLTNQNEDEVSKL